NTADQINATWGSSGALPVVSLNGNYSNGKHIVDDGGIARGSIDLDWTVFDGMRMFATHSKNQSLDEINSIYFRAMVENTIRQVINQYYLIVSTQQQMVSIQQTLAVSQTRYEHVLARHEIGSASKLDALNAKVDFNTDSSSYLRAEEQILSAKASLNQLLARPINTEFEVVEDIPFTPYMDFANLHAKALEQNTDLNIARLETMMGEATLKETDALLMPTVSLNAGYDFMRLNQNSMGFYYGAGFRMNLFNGLETARKRKNARLELESIKLAEEASILDLETRLRLNFINYQTNRDLVILESENIDVAKQNMDISLERYKLGNLSALELRESQRNYLNAIDRYTNSLYLTKLAETILKQLAGELGK
ncbi:MAG: TolC family protein, partial [Bacteroidales bacterium]|nr:TolC family protein [Bacteroidales bacterium]